MKEEWRFSGAGMSSFNPSSDNTVVEDRENKSIGYSNSGTRVRKGKTSIRL
jgi:hypothetical protein